MNPCKCSQFYFNDLIKTVISVYYEALDFQVLLGSAISKDWHWMLCVMTAIGVFVCRPIDILAPCRTVWWITVCVS